MSILAWPKNERPREKMLLRGAHALSDAELLAIFLRTGSKGVSAVDLARNLLEEFGGLRALLNADRIQFCKGRGLGIVKFTVLQASLEMARRYFAEPLQDRSVIANSQDTRMFLLAQLRDLTQEIFACMFLDNRHRVIQYEHLFEGTLNSANVYPREVVKRALKHNSAAVIFAHNHPSGIAEPSDADKHLTRQLRSALALVDIEVLDHIVIGDNQLISFAECGLI